MFSSRVNTRWAWDPKGVHRRQVARRRLGRITPELSSLCCGKAIRADRCVHACVGSLSPSHQSPSMSSGAPGDPPTCRKGGPSRPTRAKSSIRFRSTCESGPNPSLLAVGLAPSPSPGANPNTELGGVSLRLKNNQRASAGPPPYRVVPGPLGGSLLKADPPARKWPDLLGR